MRERILMACVAGFLLGIFYASFFPITLPVSVSCVGCACIFLVAAHMGNRPTVAYLIVFALCFFLVGTFRFDIARMRVDPDIVPREGMRVSIEGRVVAESDVRERNTRLTVDVQTIDGVVLSRHLRVLAIAPAFSHVSYGDVVAVSGKLRKPEAFEAGAGRSFDYPMYLASHGISYEIDFAHIDVNGHGGNPMVRAALAIKSVYIHGLRAVLPEPYAGLAAGITAGDKRSVGSELSDVFMRVSLVHILVLSGYNITVVMGALLRIFRGVSRVPKLTVSLATVVFFILISGVAPSSVRAGAMAFAAVFATMYGRRFVALRVLTAIVAAMVLWNPYVLAFDPGFQLSVLATFGLIVYAGPLSLSLKFVTERFAIREIVAATLSTQIAVLPLLLYQNGTLSIVALPTNILALIAVPFAMAFSALAAISGALFGSWGTLLALPAYILLRYIVLVAEVFASFPLAAITIPPFNGYVLLAVYAIFAGLSVWTLRRRVEPIRKQP